MFNCRDLRRGVFAAPLWLASERPPLATSSRTRRPLGREPGRERRMHSLASLERRGCGALGALLWNSLSGARGWKWPKPAASRSGCSDDPNTACWSVADAGTTHTQTATRTAHARSRFARETSSRRARPEGTELATPVHTEDGSSPILLRRVEAVGLARTPPAGSPPMRGTPHTRAAPRTAHALSRFKYGGPGSMSDSLDLLELHFERRPHGCGPSPPHAAGIRGFAGGRVEW